MAYRYLNLLLRKHLALDETEYTLLDAPQHGLVCRFMGLQLASAFQPLFRADGKVCGHEALLRAGVAGQHTVTPASAFDKAVHAGRLVQFDRLVRTIHLLNHARNAAEDELLFLNVHPQLLTSVGDHGRTFEQILHYYSVPTSQVVIEIKAAAVSDAARLEEAVNNYRSLGYRIALDDLDVAHDSLERVLSLRPDFVKLDVATLPSSGLSRDTTSILFTATETLRANGIQVGVKGIETVEQLLTARSAGAELMQGFHLGRPKHYPPPVRQRIGRDLRVAS